MKQFIIAVAFVIFPLTSDATSSKVIMNGSALTGKQIASLEKAYKIKVAPGKYWCDGKSGLWGLEGRPAAGFMQPKHCVGKLNANASKGNSKVYINGRHLSAQEASWWAGLMGSQPVPGKYNLDQYGTFSGVSVLTGFPFAFNIVAAAGQRGQTGGWAKGGNIHRGFYSGVGAGSQGGCFYAIDSEFSYSGPGC